MNNKQIDINGQHFEPTQAVTEPGANNDLQTDVVIIGAGLAGWAVVDALRAKNADIDITLMSADNADRYHKPMLSVAFSQNKTADDLIRMTGEVAAAKANIRLLTQTHVLAINHQSRQLETDKGPVHYNNLVMAIGAMPAVPACFDSKDIWHINTIDSFAQIQAALADTSDTKGRHIAVIGAGMIGTEIAEDLAKAGHQITLIDMNDAPLAAMLPPIVTDKIKQALQAQGIRFMGHGRVQTVQRLAAGGYQLAVVNGRTHEEQIIKVDHILMSTGLKVDPKLPRSAEIDFDEQTGIAVDEASLQTSVANIYAIGDCMSIGGVPCRYVAPLRAQAAAIAEHIAGQQQAYTPQPYIHKPPMIRLKNKSISVTATGTPSADESKGVWRITDETETELSCDMVLAQVSEAGETIATVTVKMPKQATKNPA